jgi:hypothetical protein
MTMLLVVASSDVGTTSARARCLLKWLVCGSPLPFHSASALQLLPLLLASVVVAICSCLLITARTPRTIDYRSVQRRVRDYKEMEVTFWL